MRNTLQALAFLQSLAEIRALLSSLTPTLARAFPSLLSEVLNAWLFLARRILYAGLSPLLPAHCP